MSVQSKELAKINLDRELAELKKLILNKFNGCEDDIKTNIRKFSQFTTGLHKAEIPSDLEYDELLFNNTLPIPFAGKALEDVLEAGDVIMALEAFPTIRPRTFNVAWNIYKRNLHKGTTISSREMMFWIIEFGTKHFLTTHEHKEYDYREPEKQEPKEEKDKYKEKKKFRKAGG